MSCSKFCIFFIYSYCLITVLSGMKRERQWSEADRMRRQVFEDTDTPTRNCTFVPFHDQVLAWHNNYVLHTPNGHIDECKTECEKNQHGFTCLSFEFVPMANYDCVLSNSTRDTAVLLYNRTELMEQVEGAVYTEHMCAPLVGNNSNQVGGECDDGWDMIGDHCFTVVNATITFDEAIEKCVEQNSTLASIHSQDEEDYLIAQMDRTGASQLWIGLRNPSGQEMEWIDGTDMDFRTTLGISLNDNGNKTEEKCVRLLFNYFTYAGWWDVSCERKLCYICKKVGGST